METFPYHRCGRNRGRDSLRIGGWWFAPKSTVEVETLHRASSSSAGRLRQVAADRAGAGEKFRCPLSGQSVYEQTSAVFRHTVSVRDDKVQEQHWRQALEQKSHAPPARPRGDITAQSHCVPDGQSVRMTKSRRSGQSQTPSEVSSVFRETNQSERRQLNVSGGIPRGRRRPKPCSCHVSSRAHRKRPALPPTQRHHVLHSHRKSHERSACAPAVRAVSLL